jgi:hypothetical protein
MVAGVRHADRPAIIGQHALVGAVVALERERGNRHGSAAIAVRLPGGQRFGFVPEDDAERLALRGSLFRIGLVAVPLVVLGAIMIWFSK